MTHARCWFFECDHSEGLYHPARCTVQVRSYDVKWRDAKAQAERHGWLFEGKFSCYCPQHAPLHQPQVEP